MNVYGSLNGSLSAPANAVGALSSATTLYGSLNHLYGSVAGSLTPASTLQGILSSAQRLHGDLTIPASGSVPVYRGAYEFTPSQQEQVIQIDHKEALADIKINAIPKCYGLITYNGTTITVS